MCGLCKGLHDDSRLMVLESPKWIMAFGLGCPVEHAQTMALTIFLRGSYDLCQYLLALLGLLGLYTSFDHHQRGVIFLIQSPDVGGEITDSALPRGLELRLNVPVGIDADSYDIPGTIVLPQSVEDEMITLRITATVEVDNGLGVRIDSLYRLAARLRRKVLGDARQG